MRIRDINSTLEHLIIFDIDDAQLHTSDKVLHEAESRTKAAKEINSAFRDAGYKKLGSGAEASVWAKDDDSVVKIIMPEDRSTLKSAEKTFRMFYEFCRENSIQSNLPKFVEISKKGHIDTFTADGKEYIMIGMERLQPIKEGSMSQALVWMMSDLVTKDLPWEKAYNEMLKPKTWKHWDTSPTVEEIITFLKTLKGTLYVQFDVLYSTMLLLYKRGKINKVSWDLHTENVMVRKDGTLVIVDPWLTNSL